MSPIKEPTSRRGWLVDRLRALHANQSGAVAFAVLCALLITMMMALVVYDTTPAARQKLEVQTAADTAAWSQSSVEARTMNMIAFANVGKRVIMGQTLFYQMLWAAWFAILAVTIAALIIAVVACFFGFGCPFAKVLGKTLANIVQIMFNEGTDLASFFAEIIPRAREDIVAIDNYQVYFRDLTPWWSWGEGWRRGMRNGAWVSGWPVPGNVLGTVNIPLVGSLLSTGLSDEMPIERYPNLGELCIRSLAPDLPVHLLDYAAMTALCANDCLKDNPTGGIPRAVLYLASAPLAAAGYAANCAAEYIGGTGFLTLTFPDENHRPFQLKTPANEAEWYRMTSNLTFAYRPGRDMSGHFRDKYGYMTKDYETLDALYKPDGFLGMARSEFVYQNGDPDMWHPSWSTRMRPVALPGEWAGYSGDYRMVSAFNDTVPYIGAAAGIASLLNLEGFLGGANMGTADIMDLIKAEVAFDAMTDVYIDGVAR